MRGLFRGLGANVIALGFASFFTDFASEMVFPLMPAFITGTLKAGGSTLGLIEGLANSLSSLLRILSGWLSDRFRRRKPFIFWGYGIAAVARPFFSIAMAAWHVLVIRLIDRVGKGLRLAARDALLADSCDPDVRGKAFGLQHAMDNLGAAIGPIVAWALLARHVDVRTIFLVTGIPALCVLFVIGGFVKDVSARELKPAPLRLTLKPFDGRFRYFLAIVAVFTLANSSDIFLLFHAERLGMSVTTIPLLWSGLCAIRALAGIPGGIFADRLGKKSSVMLGWTIYVVVYAVLAFTTSIPAFLAILALYGLWGALGESVTRAIVADLVPENLRGTAYGLYHFCVGLAALPASWGFGILYQRWGAMPAFATGAAIAAVSLGMLLFLRTSPPPAASKAA